MNKELFEEIRSLRNVAYKEVNGKYFLLDGAEEWFKNNFDDYMCAYKQEKEYKEAKIYDKNIKDDYCGCDDCFMDYYENYVDEDEDDEGNPRRIINDVIYASGDYLKS